MDNIGQLIKLAGARETVPAERFERVRQNVQVHWQDVLVKKRTEKHMGHLSVIAIAAGLILVAGVSIMLWNSRHLPGVSPLATVDRILGGVQIQDEPARNASIINAGTRVITGEDGRIALRMSGGQSLRIDTSSQVVVHTPNHITLQSGAIYIDTALAAAGEPVFVSTPLGTARDIGTQFQVRLTGMLLVVGVRQGLVEVSQDGNPDLSVNKGYYIELSSSGESRQHPLQADAPDWAWVETISPEFDIEGATLAQYLQWYANESGVDLVWADAESESLARAALLSGSIAGTSLGEGLLLVKQLAPFEYQLTNETLLVTLE